MNYSDLEQPTVINSSFMRMFLGCVLREPEDGGECIYNCAPNDGMFCRVEFERLVLGPLGNLKGLCFKNKACFGTPKACVDCKLKCEGYIGGCPAPLTTPAPFLDKPPIKDGLEELLILGPTCLTTNDSPDKNAECIFPWKYSGITLNECTNETDPDGK